jgi:hypothetical protein
MIIASTLSCRKNESPVARKRIIIIGLLNWEIRSVKISVLLGVLRRLAP